MSCKTLSFLAKLSIVVFCVLLLASVPSGSLAEEKQSTVLPEHVTIPLNPLPFDLRGQLRRPHGGGPFPAVLVLPACGAFLTSVDQAWGATLASWGYVALTLDVFTSRGIKGGTTCLYPAPEAVEDVRRGRDWLAARKYVDRNRIFLVGFGRGGSIVLSSVERTNYDSKAEHRVQGAAAFYPACNNEKGAMAVSTLVVVGALDELELKTCRKMAQGEDEIGLSRQKGDGVPIQLVALPNAYSGFDLPTFHKPVEIREFHFEFSQSATEQSKVLLQHFLRSLR